MKLLTKEEVIKRYTGKFIEARKRQENGKTLYEVIKVYKTIKENTLKIPEDLQESLTFYQMMNNLYGR
jgi:hypothetical protein